MQRVVFLCTGNICRSPIAEVVARAMYGELGIEFSSAGLNPNPGWGASEGSCAYVAGRGLSLTGHQSQPVTAGMLGGAAWVIGMTRSHAAIFNSRRGRIFKGRVGVLGAPGVDLSEPGFSPAAEEVADPYGMPDEAYRQTGDQICRLLEGWEPVFRAMARAKDS